MDKFPKHTLVSVAFLAALIAFGCGGGGGNGSLSTGTDTGNATGGTTGVDKIPTAKTKADVSQNIAGYGEASVSPSFFGFGDKMRAVGGMFFDNPLGLYATVRISPSGIVENL